MTRRWTLEPSIFPSRWQDETRDTFQAHAATLMAGTPASIAEIAAAIRRQDGSDRCE
jgi:hypothetical protein